MSKNFEFSGENGYTTYVAPYVYLWEKEKKRVEEEQKKKEEDALAVYNSTESRASRIRLERDKRIESCDWIINRHRDQIETGVPTTIAKEEYVAYLQYRQALRDLPSKEGFPWLGGGNDDTVCPWPIQPEVA